MKKLIALITLLSLVFAVTACGSKTVADQTTLPTQSGSETSSESTTRATGLGAGDFDINGEIIEIIGNEVTLKLMELNETDETTTRVPGSGMGKNGGGTGVPAEKNYTGEEMTLIIPVGTVIVTRVTGQSTGTTEASGTGTGPVEKEIGLNELTKGTVLKISYMDDGKTIAKILAQKPRT